MKINRLLLAFATIAICFTAQAQETSAEKVRSFADKYLSLSGYLQGGFRWDENTEPETTFYLHRARLSLSGNAAQEKVDYRLQVDMAGSPKICDLYVRYKPLKGLNLQIGQFKVPFSYENENCGPTTVEFIEYSYITTYLVRNNGMYDGIASTGRDIGFQLYGGFIERDGYNIINYNLGVFNGSGINRKDNNSSKDLIARLIVKPFKGFAVTASYMYAETNVDDGWDIYAKAPRWSVGALYEDGTWIGRTEYVHANMFGAKTDAFYALAGYNFPDNWAVYGRYEFIKDNGFVLNRERIQLGTAYKPFKFLRLQCNLSYEINDLAPAEHRNSMGLNLLVTAMF